MNDILDIKKSINQAILHIEHKFHSLATDCLKDALIKLDTLNNTSVSNALSTEYFNAIKLLVTEKYGSEGYQAFCTGSFLILQAQGHEYDLTNCLADKFCESKPQQDSHSGT